jgi:hypothetical protein
MNDDDLDAVALIDVMRVGLLPDIKIDEGSRHQRVLGVSFCDSCSMQRIGLVSERFGGR